MKKINEVFETYEYDLFSKMFGNRELDQLNIERLKKSFKKKALNTPIIVNEKMQIIDGQNRFEVRKQLSLPIIFMIEKGYSLEEVQLLNATMSKWNKMDYLKSYSDLGNVDYIQLKQFMKDFPMFSIGSAEQLMTNTSGGSNNKGQVVRIKGKSFGKSRNFEEGFFKVYDLSLAYENAYKLLSFRPFYDGYNRTIFVSAMITIFKTKVYDHNRMVQKLTKQPTALKHCTSAMRYKELIEEIYNHGSHQKVNLRFITE